MTLKSASQQKSGPGYKSKPDHDVSYKNINDHISVSSGGVLLSNTEHAILLTETGYSPVYYLPRSEINFDALKEVSLTTYCPFKGAARYWALKDDANDKPVLWGYDDPYEEVSILSKYAAFYTDRVEFRVIK